MKDIVFITPPSKFLINEFVYPSLGILYVAASAREAGYPVKVLLPSVKELNEKIDADIICVTGTTPHFPSMQDIAKANPHARLIAGGPHASAAPQSLLDAGFDTVICGEGEHAILDALKGTTGIIYADRIKDLDSLPLPARDLIPMERYTYDLEGIRSTYLMANRGCLWKCGFCSKPWDGNNVTRRAVKNVIDEALYLREQFGFEGIMFFDDVFTLNQGWLEEFCQRMKPTGMKWRCFLRSDTASHKKLKLMKEAGCIEVGVGVESASDKILKIINKNETAADHTRARQICKELDIRFKTFFIIGLPGETYETVEETRQWILNEKPDGYSLFVFIPLPGAPIYESIIKGENIYDYKLDVTDYNHYYWGGIMTEQISPGRTSALSAEEIVRLRNELAADLNTTGIHDRNNLLGKTKR
jgi:radical SAM superfamily enzyme YgiQ (UPF0313 family)